MRTLAFIGIIVAGIFGGDSPVQKGEESYAGKQFYAAALAFQDALKSDDYRGQEQAVSYNIAQAYLRCDSNDIPLPDSVKANRDPKALPIQFEMALRHFKNASQGNDKQLASMAWNNIGVLLATGGKTEPALEAFKKAMRKHHDNEQARFNYELLMKQKQQQEQEKQDQEKEDQEKQNEDQQKQDQQNQDQQNQDQQNQDQQNQDQQNQDQQDQQQEKQEQDGKQGESQQKKPRDTEDGEPQEIREIPMEQAKMLLEAMNENEKKFLQQLRKKPKVRTRPQDGPDW